VTISAALSLLAELMLIGLMLGALWAVTVLLADGIARQWRGYRVRQERRAFRQYDSEVRQREHRNAIVRWGMHRWDGRR
jgi:hypothetical protein